MNIEYITQVCSRAERELFDLVKKWKVITVTQAGKQLNRTETAILKSARKHRYLNHNKKEKSLTITQGVEFDIPSQDDSIFDNLKFITKRLIENRGVYTYTLYREEVVGYQDKRYDWENGALLPVTAETFKVHKCDIRKKYWFEINEEPL